MYFEWLSWFYLVYHVLGIDLQVKSLVLASALDYVSLTSTLNFVACLSS